MEPKTRPTRKAQLHAYIAVLRALSSIKLDWSKQKLLVDLRKQLRITVEQHVRSLDRVLKDPEVIAIREGLPLPARSGVPSAGKRDRPVSPVHRAPHAAYSRPGLQQEETRTVKHARRSGSQQPGSRGGGSRGGGRHGRGGRSGRDPVVRGMPTQGLSTVSSASTTSTSHPAPSPSHGSEEVNKYVGKRVVVFWKDSDPQWVEAVITDFNRETLKHCITYDFNTGHESWHWLDVDSELKRGGIQLVPGAPVDLQTVVPMACEENAEEDGKGRVAAAVPTGCGYNVAELTAPYESSVLEECLETATMQELEQMKHKVVQQQKGALAKLIDMGEPALEGADPLVKALVECEKLMRRENTLKDQLKRMENERHEMRQNNDVQGSRHVDVNKK